MYVSNIYALVTKIGIGRRTLRTIFRVFNFRRKRSSTKNFNDENFAIYSMSVYSMQEYMHRSVVNYCTNAATAFWYIG